MLSQAECEEYLSRTIPGGPVTARDPATGQSFDFLDESVGELHDAIASLESAVRPDFSGTVQSVVTKRPACIDVVRPPDARPPSARRRP